MSPRSRRSAACVALGLASVTALSGCGKPGPEKATASPLRAIVTDPQATEAPSAAAPLARAELNVTVAPLTSRLRPDVLVTGKRTYSPTGLRALTALSPKYGVVVFRAGTVKLAGQDVQAVAVDPSTFRRFSAQGTAEATPVWLSVARGEAVLSHSLAKTLKLDLGGEASPNPAKGGDPLPLRIGAFASTGIPGTDLIVDDALGQRLGLPKASAMLLTAGQSVDPVVLASKVRRSPGAPCWRGRPAHPAVRQPGRVPHR